MDGPLRIAEEYQNERMVPCSGQSVKMMESKHVVILLGPPGSGKGTQARELSRIFRVPHISTGDMMRKAARDQTPLGRLAHSKMIAGELVPDELVSGILADRIIEADCVRGFILDGFPRTVVQARFLHDRLRGEERCMPIAVNLRVSRKVLIRRITGRIICTVCGEIYNLYYKSPRIEGRCDRDDGRLVRRSDDREDTICKRLIEYKNQTQPLIRYYRAMKLLQYINAQADRGALTEQMTELLQDQLLFPPLLPQLDETRRKLQSDWP